MQKIATKATGNNRYYILDASRFFAAMAVVLFHFFFLSWSAEHVDSVSYKSIGEFFKYGYLGVQFFFLISGFVIFMSIQKGGVIEFIASRASRLYPAYWFAVLLTSIFIICIDKNTDELQAVDILVNLTMLQKFFNIPNIDGVYWTLAIELIFYFWITVLLATKSVGKFETFAFVFLLISSLSRFLHFPNSINLILLTEYSPYFIAGASFYLICQQGTSPIKISLIIASFFLSLHQAIFLQLPTIQLKHSSIFSEMIVALIIAFFYLFFLVVCLKKHKTYRPKIYVFLGALTYPLYLTHQQIGYILMDSLSGAINKYILVLLVVIICLLISSFIYLYIETPISKNMRARILNICSTISFKMGYPKKRQDA